MNEDKKLLALFAIEPNGLSEDTINGLSEDTINRLSASTINRLSASTINRLSASTINGLSEDTINGLSEDTINGLSEDTINRLSEDTINGLSASTINRLSASTINGLSEDTINRFKKYKAILDSVPVIEKPYTRMLHEIQEKKRMHQQSTFGSIETWEQACKSENNICNTPMCTAGMMVHMAGKEGYELKKQFGFSLAATFLHRKAHPDFPCQNFGSIPQEWAMAYIEQAAEFERTGINPYK